MAQGLFQPIYPNPYIVGNPIRGREMFFGRLDEFHFIARALDDGRKAALIVLFGERRSGKSSILYQIQNGQLGPAFLPIFVDMQIMAGIASETEFFSRLITDAGKALGKTGPPVVPYILRPDDSNPAEKFRQYLRALKEQFPGRALLLLIDEYEILENKITEGCLSRNVLTFFGGLLESEQVSFVFTGSKRLESHNAELWGSELLQKATSRKISFLTRDDTARLVTQPLENKVTFTPEVLEQIYGLTAGQPFYTQLICQNLVYHLNEVKKYFVDGQDLEAVVTGILDNPPPQMIFNWGEHSPEHKLTLALLADFSKKPGRYLSTASIRHRIKQNKLDIVLNEAKLKTWLTDLCKDEYLLQQDYRFAFRLDLFRRWIRHDHNIWQVKKEIGQEELDRICEREREKKEKKKKIIIILERIALAAAVLAVAILGLQFYKALQKSVIIKANGGPFMVKVDGKTLGDTKGQEDSTILIYRENLKSLFSKKKLTKGQSYEFEATLLFSQETQRQNVEINEDNQTVPFRFREDSVIVIADAESLAVRLGKQEVHTKSWRHAFYACAGEYVLEARHASSGESKIDTIKIESAKHDTVKIDFPNLVVITLKANLPFKYKYEWSRVKKERGKLLESQTADSIFILRGRPKGYYQFTLESSRGETKNFPKDITTDEVLKLNFNPKWEPEPPPRKTYHLTITSVPDGAKVLFAGKAVGYTKFDTILAAAAYSIMLEKDGYDSFALPIVLKSDMAIPITFIKKDTLISAAPEAQFGFLIVKVKNQKERPVFEAKVFVDEIPYGETPLKELKLKAGKRGVRVEHSDYFAKTDTVLIKKDEHHDVTITLEEKP